MRCEGWQRGAGGDGLKMRFAFESAAFLCELRSGNLLKLFIARWGTGNCN